MSQCTTTLAIRLVRPAKTRVNLWCAVCSESSLIACDFYSIQAIQRGINKNTRHTEWMYWLIWVFAGHTGLIVSFVVRWLKCFVFFLFFFLIIMYITDIFSKIWVTELQLFWERVAKSAFHLFFLWLFNCICLSFPLMLRTRCGSGYISSWVHLFTLDYSVHPCSIIWASASHNLQNGMCAKRRLRSA